jgi:repressor LexA
MSPSDISDRQKQILDFILEMVQRRGYPPSVREIGVIDSGDEGELRRATVRDVPLVGRIAAGSPILAQEDIEEIFPLPTELVGNEPVIMLRVQGDSMINAGIFDGDMVVVRRQPDAGNGELVAALIDGEEATVKRFRRDGDRVLLIAENPAYEPIVLTGGVEIIGKVVAVLRTVR